MDLSMVVHGSGAGGVSSSTAAVALHSLKVADYGTATNFLFGGLAGVASKTLVAPIERVKLLLQVQSAAKNIATENRYKGLIDCMVRIPKEQGWTSFWRGNTINVIRGFPKNAIIFATKDKYQVLFTRLWASPSRNNAGGSKWSKQLGPNVLSGSAAGVTALCFLQPLDFLRTRLAADTGRSGGREFNGLIACLVKTFKVDGIPGLYRGFLVSVPEIMIFRGAYFGLYDTAKELLGFNKPNRKKPSVVLTYFVAQGTTTASGLIAYPFDTVRRRMMMQSCIASGERVYVNTRSCWIKIYREEGLGSFYRGGLPNVLRGFGGALVLVVYDKIRDTT